MPDDTTNNGSPGNEGALPRKNPHPETPPYWKRAHLDWRMWIGLVFMFSAIVIYVLSDNLAFLPWR